MTVFQTDGPWSVQLVWSDHHLSERTGLFLVNGISQPLSERTALFLVNGISQPQKRLPPETSLEAENKDDEISVTTNTSNIYATSATP